MQVRRNPGPTIPKEYLLRRCRCRSWGWSGGRWSVGGRRLFRNYLTQQIGLIMRNHGQPVTIGPSDTPIPVHFAVANDASINVPQEGATDFILRDVFDVPDLSTTNDDIVNGAFTSEDGTGPLAPFTAQRIDYSLARLSHYTATDPQYFQNHVLFTNYQFYVEEFEAYARTQLADPKSGYDAFVSTGNARITEADAQIVQPLKLKSGVAG